MPPSPQAVLHTPPTVSGLESRFTGKRVHFIGVGGCGMSGLARMLLDSGAIVSGSDPKPNATTFELIRRGVKVSREQMGELLDRTVDLVVRTAAIPDSNPEYQTACRLGLPTLKYAQLLGQVMQERIGIGVCGTHGKSTTTAMTAFALAECGLDPSFVVGGTVPQLGGGSHSGRGDAFVVEACEFDRSFHNLHPRIALLTNIEADHLDCYRDLNDIIDAFRLFIARVPADGLVIANGQDPQVQHALASVHCPVETVGLSAGYTWSVRVTGVEQGCYVGEVRHRDTLVGALQPGVAGLHNLFNSTLALAAALTCGASADRAIAALGEFRGVDRRMTEMGRRRGAILVDDYGHHPTEVRATLAAVRGRYQPRRLICVFQPHQHSRTRLLLEEFATCFADADVVIIPNIYAVRDSLEERAAISALDLVRRVEQTGKPVLHLPDPPAIIAHLRDELGEGDLVLTMGAGNIWEVSRELAE